MDKIILTLVFAGLLIGRNAYSQPTKQELHQLTGHEENLIDAEKECDIIVIARFITLGSLNLGPLGVTMYERASLAITKTLKGNVSGSIKVLYSIQYLKEEQPKIGKDYICFIKAYKSGDLENIKIIEATDDAVGKVTALLRH